MANYVRLNDGAASSARNRQIGSLHHIETCCHYASMRQIHAAIEHWRRGDFECAITLAGAAERMLPEIDEPQYRELQDVARVNEVSNWLIHGTSRNGAKSERTDIIVIEEFDTVVAIHRAILKFEAVFWKDKTPQMTSFRTCGRVQTQVQSS
jgi:tRNA threonylcarbamoyladenosine modification (KEOPS) complex Cgi121 subunit